MNRPGTHRSDRRSAGWRGGVNRPGTQKPRKRPAIDRRRHHQQAQLRPQPALDVQAQGEGEIRVQVPLMRLVEDHAGHALQPRVGLQAADQQALRHHLDPRRGRDLAIQARGQAHRLTHSLAQGLRHSARGGTRGHAARFQQQQLSALHPWLIPQDERHQRCLARAWGGDQDGIGAGAQCRQQRGQRGGNREQGREKEFSRTLFFCVCHLVLNPGKAPLYATFCQGWARSQPAAAPSSAASAK